MTASLIRYRSAVAVIALVSAAGVQVLAHDFWIGPSAFRPKPGGLVGLRLLVGQDLIGDPVPREPEAIKQFVVSSATGTKQVPGRDGGDPAGIIRVETTGLLIIGYQSHPRPIELAPDKFEQYLGEEGLDEIRSVFSAANGRKSPAREMFSRCAKTLLTSGSATDSEQDRALGLTLELVAERNPYATAAGQDLPFVLTYEGKPRPGALVIAMSERDPSRKLHARTDAQGRVMFRLPIGGAWLVKTVHMIAAKPGTNVEWESFWASSTFEIGEASASSSR